MVLFYLIFIKSVHGQNIKKARKRKTCSRSLQSRYKKTRQIAKEVRMNFGDIGAIINKAKEENEA